MTSSLLSRALLTKLLSPILASSSSGGILVHCELVNGASSYSTAAIFRQCRHFRHNNNDSCRALCTSGVGCAAATTKAKKPVLPSPDNKKSKPVVNIWKNMTVSELATSVGRSLDHVFEAMIYVKNADAYDTPKSQIDDIQVIRDIARTLGVRTKIDSPASGKDKTASHHDELEKGAVLNPRPVMAKDLAPRPPVVAIMGHVDHGKTTLLDALRNTAVAASEAGGITQHIGAFVVEVAGGKVTFLDTPGHAAFSALRQRGANGADLVILVVAADDGVMEQTKESIRMIKAANVPMIVAINKIDKGAADVERSKRMLLLEGIQLEDFGGDVQCVPISAAKGTNLPTLVEAILVQAELQNLQSESKGFVEGVVLEARVDPGRGKLCTALVQRGALRKSAILVAGTAWAKVRGMFDEHGHPLQKAGPSTPVEVIGWRDLPSAGDTIYEVESEQIAKSVVECRIAKDMEDKAKSDAVVIEQKHQDHLKDYKAILAEKRRLGRFRLKPTGPRQKQFQEDTTIRLPIIVKADVDGSIEALLDVLETYDCHDQCRLDLVHYGVGDLTETDIKLAETFQAHIYGFNVKISEQLKNECKKLGIEFRLSNVIYRIIESMKGDIGSRLPTKPVEEILGEATVLALFKVSEGKKKAVMVAGSRCTKGVLKRNALYRVQRGEDVIFDGKIHSMRHLKEEVESIKNGVECGLAFVPRQESKMEEGSAVAEDFSPKEGDHIICYTHNQVAQSCGWDPGF
ncbi:translation initiation factor IF-2, mitochondrial [Folsomia candida]|uniref:translation initiation factor IF-2, mitochondrial n=1 Tax=Folsomia candida TaxID=158441 RepID=UPI000B8FC0A7|nr:translation initiation factor IF-2, mitochondrial [Folsomia candida]